MIRGLVNLKFKGHMEQTKNYEMFKRHVANRGINAKNVEKIRESIKDKNMLHLRPIIVNSNYEIIDGQHRLEAAKELQLDLFYVVHHDSKDSDMILLNNNQKKWTLHEYLNYYCEMCSHEYIEFKKFLNNTPWIDITTALALIGKNSGTEWRKFKDGELLFVKAYAENDVKIMFAEEIVMIIKNTLINRDKRPFSGTRFIAALSFLCSQDGFDMELFTKKLKGKLDCIHACATIEGYLQMLKAVYNYRNTNPIP